MILKNDNLGLLCGTFLGSILGSSITILVMKKLKKLEIKRNLEEEQKHLDEVYKFYNDKIKDLEVMKKDVNYAEISAQKAPKNNGYVSTIKVTEDGRIDPAEMGVKVLKNDVSDEVIVEGDRDYKPKVNYSKISQEKYKNLTKEYDRDEPELDENPYPVQITKEQFEDEIAYRKENLIYYEQDGIFAGYDDVPVNDVYDEKYFGYENLGLFGSAQASLDGLSSDNELYLRDRLHNVDFHLIYNPTEAFADIMKAGLDNSD